MTSRSSYFSPAKLLEYLREAGKEVFLHQLDFVTDTLLMSKIRVLLADDVGLGKTVQAALLIKAALEGGRASRALLAVPRAVLEQWIGELSKFKIRHYVVEEPDFPRGYSVYLTTIDRAKKEEYWDKFLKEVNCDFVVVDEAHKVRPGIDREWVRHLCRYAEHCLLLTATPHSGDLEQYNALVDAVGGTVIRRDKLDVKELEGLRIPALKYWVVKVHSQDEVRLANRILSVLSAAKRVDSIVLVVARKRALSSPVAFLKTISKIAGDKGAKCDEEFIDRGELDVCLGELARNEELAELVREYISIKDKKLEALRRLLNEKLKERKVLVFTEYATTAEYLFRSLAQGCRVAESGEGFGRADCGWLGVMYADARARGRLSEKKLKEFANSHSTAVFISTDMMSEGVNLQMFNAVVNYEVVWSPTKHIQRIGRVWRLGQTSLDVIAVDLLLYAGDGASEYRYYVELMEKLYEISKVSFVPIASSEAVEVYEVGEAEVAKMYRRSSAVYVSEKRAYEDAISGRLEELKKVIDSALGSVKKKPAYMVEEGVRVKLGLGGPAPSPGEYYLAYVKYVADGVQIFGERVLVRFDEGGRSEVYREVQVDWAFVAEVPGEVSKGEWDAVYNAIMNHVVRPLREYISYLGNLLMRGKLDVKSPFPENIGIGEMEVKRAAVSPKAQAAQEAKAGVSYALARPETVKRAEEGSDKDREFWARVEQIIEESEAKYRIERVAVDCAMKKLKELGYKIVHGYISVQRPFDMEVEKDGVRYLVEIKGKSANRKGEPIVFTLSEVALARQSPDRYLVYVVYVDGERCVEEVGPMTFREFEEKWELRKGEEVEHRCIAYERAEGKTGQPSRESGGC